MSRRLFLSFAAVRIVMALLSQTWHVPDETWQSVEVAHRIVFGYGYSTWEWREALRSYLYPLMFVPLLYVLKITGLDTAYLVVILPRVLQGIISAVGDVCITKFCAKHFGNTDRVRKWFLVVYTTNWFMLYCSSRTLVNSMEMTLTSVALYFYPKPAYVPVIAFSFIIRPTTAIMWLPLVLRHVYAAGIGTTVTRLLPPAVSVVIASTAIDSWMYGRPVCVPLSFLQFNVFSGLASHYGTHPPTWYLFNALPIIFAGIGTVLLFIGLYRLRNFFAFTIIWTISVYSLITAHKEYRFLLPIVPLSCCFISTALRFIRWRFLLVTLMVLSNLSAVIYLSVVHQRGVTDVVAHLSNDLPQKSSVLYLMPCHSTPYFSHLHRHLDSRFLTCEPNLDFEEGYTDEADVFYNDPAQWLKSHYNSRNVPSHIVCFDVLVPRIADFLQQHGFTRCARFFHAHIVEGRVGRNVDLFCQKAL